MEKKCEEKEVEQEVDIEEESLGRENDVDSSGEGTSVLSDIPNLEGTDVQDEGLVALHLIQDRLLSSRLDGANRNAVKNTSLAALRDLIKAIQPKFLSTPPTSIPWTATIPQTSYTPTPSLSYTASTPTQKTCRAAMELPSAQAISLGKVGGK